MVTNSSTALITGGTSGIGRAAANKLAQLGSHVIVVGRNAERGEKTVAEIRAAGGKADLTSSDLYHSRRHAERPGTDTITVRADFYEHVSTCFELTQNWRSKLLKAKWRTSSGREVHPNVMRRLPPILGALFRQR